MTHISVLLLTLLSYTVHQVQQQLARHGLYAGQQGLVVHVLREQVHGHGQLGHGQGLAHVVDQVR